ncbi:MAG: NAD-dependent epimerase/dehydratase family protein [Desulfobacteraceae bacterium]|jgi:UDP-glucuronate 4-epimerase
MADQENNHTVLVTGAAGFIGFHLSRKLLEKGNQVIGVDNLNPYYDVSLKKARLDLLTPLQDFVFYKEDIQNLSGLRKIFQKHAIGRICNLAAQAGVRHSLKDPFSYQKSNLEGFLNLLELGREYEVNNFVYASSSSVYGDSPKIPFSVDDRVDTPVSLYGATKKANELMAYAYSHLFSIPCTGLRFFTVYGPWGRPDMALFLFTDAILNDRPINVYNYGRMKRDFTYVDDVVEGTIAAIEKPFAYEVFNLGNSDPIELMDFIGIIEEELGQEAQKNMMSLQPGDVLETSADIGKSKDMLGFSPKTPIREGIKKFLTWYREYYKV